jgi:CO/xanthine dehydrogenase Mo-binding subunit
MDIEFLPSTEKPMGLGEPGVTTIAPAIGNAIFNAVGVRLRHLPIRPADVLAGLHKAG